MREVRCPVHGTKFAEVHGAAEGLLVVRCRSCRRDHDLPVYVTHEFDLNTLSVIATHVQEIRV